MESVFSIEEAVTEIAYSYSSRFAITCHLEIDV